MTTTNQGTAPSKELDIINHIRGEVMGISEQTGVNLFLIWGYPTVFCFLMEFAALTLWQKNLTEWFWAVIPLIGVPLTIYFLHKDYDRTGRRTHNENIALMLWFFVGGASCLGGFTTGMAEVYIQCYCTLQGLLIATGCFVTGVIARFLPMKVGGLIGGVLSFVCPFLQNDLCHWQLLVVALVTIITLVIPGHLLRHYVRRLHSE